MSDDGRHPDLSTELAVLVGLLAAGRRSWEDERKVRTAERLNDPAAARERSLTARQDQAAAALDAVLGFLHSPAMLAAYPDVLRRGLTHHLRDLHDALGDLAAGVPPDLFQMPKGRTRKPSPSEGRLRGRAVAIVEMLRGAGEKPEKAADLVAGVLNRSGYANPYGRKEGVEPRPITGARVRSWHERLGQKPAGTPIRVAYENSMAMARDLNAKGMTWGQIAANALAMLYADNPDGAAVFLPLRGDPEP